MRQIHRPRLSLADSSALRCALLCSMARKLVSRLRDPYSRFLDVSEFGAMAKYDVSGVGLNLGTADELERKTVR
jgi:hypothetical protein